MSNGWDEEHSKMPGDPDDDFDDAAEYEGEEASQNNLEEDDRQEQQDRFSDPAEKHKHGHHGRRDMYRAKPTRGEKEREEQEERERRRAARSELNNDRPSEAPSRDADMDLYHTRRTNETLENRAQRRAAEAFTFNTRVFLVTKGATLAQLEATKTDNPESVLKAAISKNAMGKLFDALKGSGLSENLDSLVRQNLDTKKTDDVFNTQTCQITKMVLRQTHSTLALPVFVSWSGKSGLKDANNLFVEFSDGGSKNAMAVILPGSQSMNVVLVDRSNIHKSQLHQVFGSRTFKDIATKDFQPITHPEQFAGMIKVRRPSRPIPGDATSGPAPLFDSVVTACEAAGKQMHAWGKTHIVVPHDIVEQVLTNAQKRVLRPMDQLNIQSEDGLTFLVGPYENGNALTNMSGTEYDPTVPGNQDRAEHYRQNKVFNVSMELQIHYTLHRNTGTAQSKLSKKTTRMDPMQKFQDMISNVELL